MNKVKTNIKMWVTREQLVEIEKIAMLQKLEVFGFRSQRGNAIIVTEGKIELALSSSTSFQFLNYEEVDADLFIRTDGTCEDKNAEPKSFERAINVFERAYKDFVLAYELFHKAITELKPKSKTVTMPDGTILPEPVREIKTNGTEYWIVSLGHSEGVELFKSYGLGYETKLLLRGLIHRTEKDARAWYKYLLSLTQRS